MSEQKNNSTAAAAEMFCVFGGFAKSSSRRNPSHEMLLWIFADLEQADAAARGLAADPEMLLKHGCPVSVKFWYSSQFKSPAALDDEEQTQWDAEVFAMLGGLLRLAYVVRCVGGHPVQLMESYGVDAWDGSVGGES